MVGKMLVWWLGFSMAVVSCFASASPDNDKKYSSFIGKALNGVSKEVVEASCISKQDFQTYRIPNYQKYVSMGAISDTADLIDLLDVMASEYKYDFRFAKFRDQILEDYVRNGRPPAAVVSMSAHDFEVLSRIGDLEEWGLTPETEMLYKNGETHALRKTCLDGIVDDVLVGRHLLAIVTAKADTKTRKQRELVAHQLVNTMIDKERSVVQFLSNNPNYEFTLNTYSFSGITNITSWNMFNFREKFLEFETNGEEYNTILRFNILRYGLLVDDETKNRENDFAFYVKPQSVVSDWAEYIDKTYTSRCSSSDDLERQALCKLTKIKYESMKATCASIDTWPDCANPYNKACTLEDGNYCDALKSLEPIELNHGCEATCENENKNDDENDDKPDPKKDEDHNVNSSSAGSASLMVLALLGGLGRKRWLRS